jgi:DNA-binding transcriptional LysR family regulator
MNLDADDLILFARIVDAGSLAAAAERAGLPKSTLSRRLAQLEKRLGERLLTRSTRRLAITPFGEHMLEHARRLAEECAAAAAWAQNQQERPRGLLRVSLPPDFNELNLTPMLLRFAADYPEVRLELDLSPRRVDLLAERFDLAVRIASQLPDDASLVARRLCQFTGSLYASPAYLARHGMPAEPSQLQEGHVALPLIGGDGEVVPWQLSDGRQRWEWQPGGQLAANSLGLQRELAMHGLGIVGLSDRLATTGVAEGRLQRVLPDWQFPTVTVWCVTPGRRLLPARTQALIEALRANLGEDMA